MPESPENQLSYFIIGPARCGKTTLADRVRAATGAAYLPTDALHEGIKVAAGWEWQEWMGVSDERQEYDEWIDLIRVRDDFYAGFLAPIHERSVDKHRQPVISDGAYWPRHISELAIPHKKVVCLVDTSPEQWRRLQTIQTDDGANNWQDQFDQGRLERWASYNARRSQEYASEAARYGYTVVDIALCESVAEASDKAYRELGFTPQEDQTPTVDG